MARPAGQSLGMKRASAGAKVRGQWAPARQELARLFPRYLTASCNTATSRGQSEKEELRTKTETEGWDRRETQREGGRKGKRE